MSSNTQAIGFYKQSQIVTTPTNKGKETILPISRGAWIKGIEAGRYPAPVYLAGIKVWSKASIHELLESISAGEHQTEFSTYAPSRKPTN